MQPHRDPGIELSVQVPALPRLSPSSASLRAPGLRLPSPDAVEAPSSPTLLEAGRARHACWGGRRQACPRVLSLKVTLPHTENSVQAPCQQWAEDGSSAHDG